MGEKSHYFTFDQIKLRGLKSRNYWCVKKIPSPKNFRFQQGAGGAAGRGGGGARSIG